MENPSSSSLHRNLKKETTITSWLLCLLFKTLKICSTSWIRFCKYLFNGTEGCQALQPYRSTCCLASTLTKITQRSKYNATCGLHCVVTLLVQSLYVSVVCKRNWKKKKQWQIEIRQQDCLQLPVTFAFLFVAKNLKFSERTTSFAYDS